MARLPYRPQIDMQQLHAFDEHLQQVAGSWETVGTSFVHAGAPGVIRLRWQIAGERWCDEPGFLAFLDQQQHRQLLRCFLQREPVIEEQPDATTEPVATETKIPARGVQQVWTMEALLKAMRLEARPRRLVQVLHFLELQEYIVARGPDEWVGSHWLERVEHLGPTFAWIVQAYLQQRHHALSRRCVSFKDWQTSQLNGLDVLAFTEDGLIVTVECKAGQDMAPEHLIHFVQRARIFPADVALLLIDTDSEELIITYLHQINALLNREQMDLGSRYTNEGSVIYHLIDNLCVANTTSGVDCALQTILRLGSNFKQAHYGVRV